MARLAYFDLSSSAAEGGCRHGLRAIRPQQLHRDAATGKIERFSPPRLIATANQSSLVTRFPPLPAYRYVTDEGHRS